MRRGWVPGARCARSLQDCGARSTSCSGREVCEVDELQGCEVGESMRVRAVRVDEAARREVAARLLRMPARCARRGRCRGAARVDGCEVRERVGCARSLRWLRWLRGVRGRAGCSKWTVCRWAVCPPLRLRESMRGCEVAPVWVR